MKLKGLEKEFRARASSAHSIASDGKGAITENQLKDIEYLEGLDELTRKQESELKRLIKKRDKKPELSEGAKTYCQQWLIGKIFNLTKEFYSAQTDNGTEVEDESLRWLSQVKGVEYKKNTKRFYNEYFEGEPDVIYDEAIGLRVKVEGGEITDAKNSYTPFSFPLFSLKLNPFYYTQQNVYMNLTGIRTAKVTYMLTDMSDAAAEIEAMKIGCEVEEIKSKYSYFMLPAYLRFREFVVPYDEKLIKKLEQKVIMCREYIAELIEELERKAKCYDEGIVWTPFEKEDEDLNEVVEEDVISLKNAHQIPEFSEGISKLIDEKKKTGVVEFCSTRISEEELQEIKKEYKENHGKYKGNDDVVVASTIEPDLIKATSKKIEEMKKETTPLKSKGGWF